MHVNGIYSGNVIDFEASGIEKDSYPIEVGLILKDGTAYHSLIKPCHNWKHWSEEARGVHGISKQDLHKKGKPIQQVCRELNKLCQGLTLYSDCWVLDSDWLRKLFYAADIIPAFTISPIDYFMPDQDWVEWTSIKQRIAEKEDIQLHMALHDAYVIKAILDDKLAVNNSCVMNLKRTKTLEFVNNVSVK